MPGIALTGQNDQIIIIVMIKSVTISERRAGAEAASPAYRRIPAYLIRRLQMISTAIIAEEFDGEDMPVPQWAVLTILENHPGIDQSCLAGLVGIDRTNTGRLVDQLEAKGLVERHPSDADRRVWILRCTALGHKTRKRLRRRALDTQERLLSCLDPRDRELFVDLLSRVVAANEEYVRPGAGRRKRRSR